MSVLDSILRERPRSSLIFGDVTTRHQNGTGAGHP